MLVTGVHHIKIWVTDLARSREWYEKVFDLELSMSFEDQDGVVRGMAFRVAGTDFEIALRENRRLAEALHDADPFALATTREGLDEWIAHLDARGIAHSPVIRASRGYGLGFRDPDGVQIRLYATDPAVTAESGDRVRVPPVNL
ncbi:VOC family protein [Acrocarpospora sp. B8E8]|uniref:VOC family protein n=1 Tax=Acrocarpospora sp. B8E8 TaxID=3153572 RepID=UPI00325DD3A1